MPLECILPFNYFRTLSSAQGYSSHAWRARGDHMCSWGVKLRSATCPANALPARLQSYSLLLMKLQLGRSTKVLHWCICSLAPWNGLGCRLDLPFLWDLASPGAALRNQPGVVQGSFSLLFLDQMIIRIWVFLHFKMLLLEILRKIIKDMTVIG